MRICLATSNQGGLKDLVSSNFGRCPSYTIVDVEGGEIKNPRVIQNPGFSAGSGAGMQAAQAVADAGCNVVIAGAVGPNAFQVLSMAKLEVLECPGVTVQKALEEYMQGRLQPSSGSGRGPERGHGMGRGYGNRPGDPFK